MEPLWAPWRMEYIAKASGKRSKKAKCLFCALGRTRQGARNLVLARTPRVLVMLNRYPYNVGHVMVAPIRHRGSLAQLSADESLELTEWLGKVERALGREYRPHGFNLGMNLGRTAGAGVLGHLHWHVVPRWNGDTNFMPVIAGTKVLPESLDRTYRRLRVALDGAGAAGRRPAPAARRR
jgi:ATP adenylyltransferase